MSGKELQRTLGVTYKTAYRIGMQIRDLMGKADSFQVLKGHVEIDETYSAAVGGMADENEQQDNRHGDERARRPD